MIRLFKRAETVSRVEHDRIVGLLKYQRDFWMDEVNRLRAEEKRRIAPLMAANAARREAAAKRKAGA